MRSRILCNPPLKARVYIVMLIRTLMIAVAAFVAVASAVFSPARRR